MAGVAVHGVAKSFDGTDVLRDIDLSVPDGSTLALLGPSGVGKSTLLRIIAGLERPDGGVVEIDGADVTATPTHRRGVGVVFQGQALFPHLDVQGNVAYGLRMQGGSRGQWAARVEEMLELVGLPGYERRDPSTLSGGEAQRVALARALAPGPSVILLDEPLSGLDQLLRERLLLELRSLFRMLAVTVVAVTHDPTEAAVLGDRLAVLLDGRIAQIDTPGAVLANPRTADIAHLVGHRNVIAGTVRDGTVHCLWGTFVDAEVTDGEVDILVPPDALSTSPEGTLSGSVTALLHRGGSAFAVVEGASWPALDVHAASTWTVGTPVQLAIDPDAVRYMPRGRGDARSDL